jgi:hypothetical protein
VTNGANKAEIVKNLIEGATDQKTVNAITDALIGTNQQALEDYTKNVSTYTNLKEASQNVKAGTLTNDELRQLAEENPDLFADAE